MLITKSISDTLTHMVLSWVCLLYINSDKSIKLSVFPTLALVESISMLTILYPSAHNYLPLRVWVVVSRTFEPPKIKYNQNYSKGISL